MQQAKAMLQVFAEKAFGCASSASDVVTSKLDTVHETVAWEGDKLNMLLSLILLRPSFG